MAIDVSSDGSEREKDAKIPRYLYDSHESIRVIIDIKNAFEV
jgi:hypothetical protein